MGLGLGMAWVLGLEIGWGLGIELGPGCGFGFIGFGSSRLELNICTCGKKQVHGIEFPNITQNGIMFSSHYGLAMICYW